ncbi:HTH-type transcriptional regulator GltR [Acaryochloris thomasi RCC1774]|uniref:HTH-type transcriptional regulator GltR n=1 Tax=Acaryochloris thomasi RCC1774 TaxID=1764569 RepID=A0A2W1JPL5_9CYAN|nr:LysR family transcriptional regulator [Acaryochloris thomasi]PZD75186.1 HTH-type transcriptional regulator GltR [Acaryochloris thomasi RCC1774]
MNWSDLQVLLTFQREGTLQKAATQLDLDISTVSRRIRMLEKDLGSKVVENVSGRLVLTSYGEQVVEAAEAMEVESDALQRGAKGKESVLSGVLRVALLDMFVLFHADLLNSFTVQYPQITLELVSGTTRFHSLTRREADVAIRVSTQPDENLVGMRALHTEYAVYAHVAIAEGQWSAIANQPSTPWDVLPWIGWDPAVNARMIDAWMERHVPIEQVRFRVDSPAALFMMAEAGGGACILPVIYADLSDNLVRLSDVLKGFGTDVWLLTHRDLKRNGRVQAFLNHCYQGLEPLRRRSLVSESVISAKIHP